MSILDTRVYRWAQAATDFLLLNLLWMVACLPVVTAFPATAAMFAVVRDWARGKDTAVFGGFVARFGQNLWQSLAVGVLWALVGGALVLDALIANQLPDTPQMVLRSLLVPAGILYVLSSVFLFPVMVHYDTGWTAVPKNALLLAVGKLPTTLLCLATFVAAAALVFFVPPLILILGSVAAYAVYRLCDREFRKIDAISDRG